MCGGTWDPDWFDVRLYQHQSWDAPKVEIEKGSLGVTMLTLREALELARALLAAIDTATVKA
jgi:hypothetical protein